MMLEPVFPDFWCLSCHEKGPIYPAIPPATMADRRGSAWVVTLSGQCLVFERERLFCLSAGEWPYFLRGGCRGNQLMIEVGMLDKAQKRKGSS